MNQSPLFDDTGDPLEPAGAPSASKVRAKPGSEPVTSVEEVFRIARAVLVRCGTPGAEPPVLAAKRRLWAKASGARYRGLVAKWAPYETAKGFVAIHDPIEGEWHEVRGADASSWATREAWRRARLYGEGFGDAYDLTSRQMERIWRDKHLPKEDVGIVEEFPIEEEEA